VEGILRRVEYWVFEDCAHDRSQFCMLGGREEGPRGLVTSDRSLKSGPRNLYNRHIDGEAMLIQ